MLHSQSFRTAGRIGLAMRSAFCGLPKLQLFGSRFATALLLADRFFKQRNPVRRTALSIRYSRQRSLGTQKSTFVKLVRLQSILVQVFGSCPIQSRSAIYLGFRLNESDPAVPSNSSVLLSIPLSPQDAELLPPSPCPGSIRKLARHSQKTSATQIFAIGVSRSISR